MKELLTRIRNVLYRRMPESIQEEKRGTFIEEFDSLLEKRDTSDVWRQFAIWLLVDPVYGVLKFTEPGTDEHHVIQRVAQLYKDDCKDIDKFEAARNSRSDYYLFSGVIFSGRYAHAAGRAAYRIALAAGRAALAAGRAAYRIALAAASDDLYSFYTAAASVASDAAVSSVHYAESAYNTVYSDDRAGWAAAEGHIQRMANKLLELMRVAPMLSPTI